MRRVESAARVAYKAGYRRFLEANGVPLCVDREGVDRVAVHSALAPRILAFLTSSIA